MAYRFTKTEKWRDEWFSKLPILEKLLFLYLCDNCDIAGFIEFTPTIWAAEIGAKPKEIEGACKGLARGLVFSKDCTCIFIKNFLKHQKNYPLNEKNNVYKPICNSFVSYKDKFDCQQFDDLITSPSQAPPKPLLRDLGKGKGIGNGTGNGNGIEEPTEKKIFDSELNFYNDNRGKNMTACSKMTDERKSRLKQRIKEYGIEKWHEAILKCAASDFCNGRVKGGNGWVANIDFILQPSSFQKIIEGFYDNKDIPAAKKETAISSQHHNDCDTIESYKKQKGML